jgi:ATP-dependent DNA helicase RecQ
VGRSRTGSELCTKAPAYRNLAGLKRAFGGVPVLALTATATARVIGDIIQQLQMQQPTV